MIDPKVPLLSGDQSILWDAPLKLMLLSQMGYPVHHLIHTADLFCRPPAGSTAVLVTPETCRPDGNVARWSATIESAHFLGRMPIHPTAFTGAGVDFRRLASFRNSTIDRVVAELTQGDWLGLTLPQEGLVADGVMVDELVDVFSRLRRPISQDILATVPEAQRAQAVAFFEDLYMYAAFKGRGMSLTNASLEILGKVLREQGATTELGTTLQAFRLDRHGPSALFLNYLAYEEQARAAYNRATQGGAEAILPLEPGQLPFYLVVRSYRDNRLYRQELSYQPGDTAEDVIARAASDGDAIAVLGKAMVFLLELRLRGAVVLPHNGSSYAPQSARFLREFNQILGSPLPIHPLVRLRVHALDALQDVRTQIKLPSYLVPFFGVEWVQGRELGHGWRGAMQSAHTKIEELSGEPSVQLAELLNHQGKLGSRALEHIVAVTRELDVSGALIKELALRANEKGLDADEKARRKQEFLARRSQIEVETDVEILRHFQREGLCAIDARRAEVIAALLPVTKLEYWDHRPFTHWVMAVPGWYDAIRKRAELYVDEG